MTASSHGYYNLPVLKRPHWRWEIVGYFWLGGIASGAWSVAAIVDLVGEEDDRIVARTGRLIALPLLVISPLLLIKDLGRPERFLNMLRTVNLRSPMSTGSWALLVFGGVSGLSALLEIAAIGSDRGWRVVQRDHPLVRFLVARSDQRRVVGVVGLPVSLFVGGYTGVLLSATAIPLWAKNHLLWGPTFLASAFSTGVAAIDAALAIADAGAATTHTKLHRLHTVALVAEASLIGASLARLGSTARPITAGRRGRRFWAGTIGAGIVLPLLLGLRPDRSRRSTRLIAAIGVLIGGLILRASVVYGGQASADDPAAYFDQTAAR